MKILFWMLTGASDPTRASVPLHVAANGSLELGDEPIVVLAGDGTEYLVGENLEAAQGVGVPPLWGLFTKLREHEVPVYV
jgi:predicted peroxiredoxin